MPNERIACVRNVRRNEQCEGTVQLRGTGIQQDYYLMERRRNRAVERHGEKNWRRSMDYRRFGNQLVLRVDRGEEVMESLMAVCEKEQIRLASIAGLGAADHLVMGLYDVEKQKFEETVLEQPLEITSLIGSVTEMNGHPYLHVHINVADAAGHAYGGHLKSVRIGGTAEIFLTLLDGHVGRKKDDITNTGLNLFSFDA